MLGKLIKQELKITSRYFIPMYVCFIAATLLLKLSFFFSNGDDIFVAGTADTILTLIQGIMIFIYVVLLAGICILTYVIIIRRFYTNMFGDEGYLMFTLPVTTKQLLNSKLINSILWLVIMAPMMIGSFGILFLNTDTYDTMVYYFSFLAEEFHVLNISGFQLGLLLAEFIVAAVLGTISSLLAIYLSITLGHHFLSDHRLLGSIAFYMLIGVVTSIPESFARKITEDMLNSFLMTADISDLISALHMLLPISIVMTLVLIVIYYLITHHFLNKKLNLA